MKIRFSRIFTQRTEWYGYTPLNLQQNEAEVALMSLKKFLKHIRGVPQKKRPISESRFLHK